jgi:hypothetical protein
MPLKNQTSFEKPTMPIARDRDSVTSFKAAERVVRSGWLKGQMKLVLMGVKRWPDKTSAELAVLIGVNRYDTARRLPALQHRGLVKKGPSRLCSACGSECVIWYLTAENKTPLFQGAKE